MSRINNDTGTYKTSNQFDGEMKKLINDYINKLYGQSLKLYQKRYAENNPTGTARIDIEKIEESLGYIDDYLYYFYKFNREEFSSVFMNLIHNLNFVTVLPPQKRGLYGEFRDDEKMLYINPQLDRSRTLSSDERTRLYICHELGHIQNSKWMKKLIPILNNINCTNQERQLMYDGFSLFDEATTQDRAETIAYYFSSKMRPFMRSRNTALFNGQSHETNFDYYGEFQIPTIEFARTLRGIGKIEDDDLAMQEFNKRALNENFSQRIFDEYTTDGQIQNLYFMLKKLGIIKNASYAAFGYGDRSYLDQSLSALQEYNQRAESMKDVRDPIGLHR